MFFTNTFFRTVALAIITPPVFLIWSYCSRIFKNNNNCVVYNLNLQISNFCPLTPQLPLPALSVLLHPYCHVSWKTIILVMLERIFLEQWLSPPLAPSTFPTSSFSSLSVTAAVPSKIIILVFFTNNFFRTEDFDVPFLPNFLWSSDDCLLYHS